MAFRETDLLLGPFADLYAPTLTPAQLDDFEVLLEQPDQLLYAWCRTGRAPARLNGDVLLTAAAVRRKTRRGAYRTPLPVPIFKRIAQATGRLDLTGAPEGFDALVMADIARARGGLSVFVARDGARASAFIDALSFFAPEMEVLRLPVVGLPAL